MTLEETVTEIMTWVWQTGIEEEEAKMVIANLITVFMKEKENG